MHCGRLKLISDSVNFSACTACLHARYSTLQVVPALFSCSAVTTCNDRKCRQLTPDASQLILRRANMKIHFTVKDNLFLYNKTNWRTNFPNLFLSRNSTCFGQFLCPSSGVFHCTFGTGICHQMCMIYTSTECTVEHSWWWAEELPETCRVSWQNKFGKLVRLLILLKSHTSRFSAISWYLYKEHRCD
jgi:hypothetical protein